MIARALEKLEQFAVKTSSETGFYPQTATLVKVLDSSSSTVSFRLAQARDTQNFNNTNRLEQTIERNTANIGVFPPGVKLALGDRLTITGTSDLTGQVFEVVEPITPDFALGYTAGLAYVKGSR